MHFLKVKDTDLPVFKLRLLLYPYGLLIPVSRFHAVTADGHTEISFLGNFVSDFFPGIWVTVKEIAGSCWYLDVKEF